MKFTDFVLLSFLLPFLAGSEEIATVPIGSWLRHLPLTSESAPGQFVKNGKILHLTFHSTDTPEGDGTIESEMTILNTQVHSACLYTWEWKVDSGSANREYFRRKQSDGSDIPKFGCTAYHYLVGNSGVIYKGRSDDIAPASSRHYYSRDFLKGAALDLQGCVVLQPDMARKFAGFRNETFAVWKSRIDYKKWLEGECAILRDQHVTEGAEFTKALNKRVGEQKDRLIAPGATSGHLTICFIGRDHAPSPEAFASATKLAAVLLKRHGLSVDSIHTLREVASRGCRESFVQKWVYDFTKGNRRGRLFDELKKMGIE